MSNADDLQQLEALLHAAKWLQGSRTESHAAASGQWQQHSIKTKPALAVKQWSNLHYFILRLSVCCAHSTLQR
jgi:hypothetical protein